jgi:DNA-binding MarR family transcriptional regulator
MPDSVSLEKAVELISRLTAELESQALADRRLAELSMRQTYYLSTIAHMDHPTFSGLAKKLKVTKPSVTAIVGMLIEKGYVRKVQDSDDRRTFHIVLTPKALDFNRTHADMHKRLGDFLAAHLDEREVAQLTRLLGKALPAEKR